MTVDAPNPLVYIISAPSGSGKSTLVNELLKRVPDLDFSISYTTRPPRGVEKDGRQYYFVSREEFEKMMRDQEFLEHADVFGNYYGTAKRFLRDAAAKKHDLLLDIDVQGARQMKAALPEATSIFVLPPNRVTLEERLRKRSEDAESVIQRRLVTASREIEDYDKYNYILVNDRLHESIESLHAIVRAERSRYARGPLSEADREAVALADKSRLANMRDRLQPILASFVAPAISGNQ
jgi:guanylate kinase